VPGHQRVTALRGDPLELADLGHALLRRGPDPAADGDLPVDVLGQVGRVEGEHEAPAAGGRVDPDHEALVTRRVPGGQHGGHAGRDLRVALGGPPVDPRIVEVHPVDAVLLRPGRAGQPVVEFGPLDVHWHPAGEVLQAAGVVVVQVADGDRVDAVQVHARRGQRLGQWLSRAGQHRLDQRVPVEPGAQRRVGDQRGVVAGVQQQPAAVAQEQHAGYRLAEHLLVRCPLHGHGPGQVCPAQGEQHDAADSGPHGFSLPGTLAELWPPARRRRAAGSRPGRDMDQPPQRHRCRGRSGQAVS
jgi:hypothetical protein